MRTSLPRALVFAALAAAGCRAPGAWQPLLEGQWAATPFGGAGEVRADDGGLVLEPGDPLTGVTWQAPVPAGDYELSLVAARLQGTDFFVGLTFPVDDGHLTLVLGGWGGALCGLSCLDGDDASVNETKFFEGFEDGRDYQVRLEVRGRRVRAWLDGRVVVDVDTTGRVIGLRTEVEPCAPLGVASFLTQARYRELRWRPLR